MNSQFSICELSVSQIVSLRAVICHHGHGPASGDKAAENLYGQKLCFLWLSTLMLYFKKTIGIEDVS